MHELASVSEALSLGVEAALRTSLHDDYTRRLPGWCRYSWGYLTCFQMFTEVLHSLRYTAV